jgi:hypothetical protein
MKVPRKCPLVLLVKEGSRGGKPFESEGRDERWSKETNWAGSPLLSLLRLSWLIFVLVKCGVVFEVRAEIFIIKCLKFGHDRFLTHPLQFIFQVSSFHSTLY